AAGEDVVTFAAVGQLGADESEITAVMLGATMGAAGEVEINRLFDYDAGVGEVFRGELGVGLRIRG
ncbi:MAG: hypothetical protein ABW223_05740, partial [Rariglobus sp.]